MPLYFLHITEGDTSIPASEGIERDDVAAVQKTAVDGVGDLIADAVRRGDRDYRGRILVEDETGRCVLTVTFACAVGIEMTRSPAGGGQAAAAA